MKFKELTDKQNDFYKMLVKFFSEHQRMPTVKEASRQMGYASPSASADKIERLVESGTLICKMVGGAKRYTFSEYRAVLVKLNDKAV